MRLLCRRRACEGIAHQHVVPALPGVGSRAGVAVTGVVADIPAPCAVRGLVAWLLRSRCCGDVGAWTRQAAHTSSASGELQYILGWPVPHPAFGAEYEMRSGEAEYGRLFDAWVRHIVIAVKTERSVTYFPACA